MKFFINQILATSAVMGLGAGIFNISPVSAASISYDLKFFDNSGSQVGSGEFTYNPGTSTCIQEIPVGGPCNEMINGFLVDTELTDFSASILGTVWELGSSAGQHWWDEATSTVKGTLDSRYGILLQDQWFFGDQFFAEDLLSMRGASGGTWTQVLDITNVLEGAWTAELKDTTSTGDGHVIPEPLTILGAGVAMGFGAFFKSKLK